MALTNWDLITIINTARNKNLSGEDVRVSEFQSLINAKSKMLFAEKTGKTSEFQTHRSLARGGRGLSKVMDSALSPFLRVETKSIVGGVFNTTALSNELGELIAINPVSISGRGFDELTPGEIADRIGSEVVAPSVDDPVFYWSDEDTITILPATIASINVIYYKEPDDAVIATTTSSTTLLESYNAAGSTELEWGDEEKLEIAYRVLLDLGTNIERQDVVALGVKESANE